VPENKYKFNSLQDVPRPGKLNGTYSIDLLLAMRSFFSKPSDENIETFLNNPYVKGAQKISPIVEVNILKRLAISRGELPERFSTEDVYNFAPLVSKKRKKSKEEGFSKKS